MFDDSYVSLHFVVVYVTIFLTYFYIIKLKFCTHFYAKKPKLEILALNDIFFYYLHLI